MDEKLLLDSRGGTGVHVGSGPGGGGSRDGGHLCRRRGGTGAPSGTGSPTTGSVYDALDALQPESALSDTAAPAVTTTLMGQQHWWNEPGRRFGISGALALGALWLGHSAYTTASSYDSVAAAFSAESNYAAAPVAKGLGAALVGLLSLKSEGWRYDTRIGFLDNFLCWVFWTTRILTDPKGALLNPKWPGNLSKLQAMRSSGMLGGESKMAAGAWRSILTKHKFGHRTVAVNDHCSIELLTPIAATEPLPIILWFHGGGHCIGSAKDVGMEVVLKNFRDVAVVASVEYRMGPDHPYPAAADDAIAALKYASEHRAELGATEHMCVAGLSAGGNLAAVAAHNAAALGIDLKCAMLLIPEMMVNCSGCMSRSFVECGSLQSLPTEVMAAWWQSYCPDRTRASEPNCSPLLVEPALLQKLAGKCRFVVHMASADPLRDGGLEYVDKLREAGVDVAHVVARGTHSFILFVDRKALKQSVLAWRAAFL